jgi:hypothetical protein
VIRFFLLYIILLISTIAVSAQKCTDKTVGNERRVCSHMVVEIDGIETRLVKGIVVDANNTAIPDSIIEVYEAKEDGRLVATYKTKFNGKFCFKNLPEGKYILRVGWSGLGFNCTDIKIDIKGKTKKFIRIPLQVGT